MHAGLLILLERVGEEGFGRGEIAFQERDLVQVADSVGDPDRVAELPPDRLRLVRRDTSALIIPQVFGEDPEVGDDDRDRIEVVDLAQERQGLIEEGFGLVQLRLLDGDRRQTRQRPPDSLSIVQRPAVRQRPLVQLDRPWEIALVQGAVCEIIEGAGGPLLVTKRFPDGQGVFVVPGRLVDAVKRLHDQPRPVQRLGPHGGSATIVRRDGACQPVGPLDEVPVQIPEP